MRRVDPKMLVIGIVLLIIGLSLTSMGVVTVKAAIESPTALERRLSQKTTTHAEGYELTARYDRFGVQKLNPTRSGGMVWYSSWDDGISDAWTKRVGNAEYHTDKSGILSLSGDTMRMYVREPEQKRQWTDDLEVTVYARRLPGSEDAPSYSGIVSDVRTNHGTVGNVEVDPCDSRGLFARLRFDGTADFGKEIKHPNTVARDAVSVWDGGMPMGEWIGYKQVVYTADDGVHQELWVDFPERRQKWSLVNQTVDPGGVWGTGEEPCKAGIDPSIPYLGTTTREGSESGLPNIAVLFRADDLGSGRGGLEYKWASVREVNVPRG